MSACPRYPAMLELAAGDLVRLDDARGTTLRVTRGTLWITQDRDQNDIVLAAGDTWTIERDGLTLAEAQNDAIVCLAGTAAERAELRPRRAPAVASASRWLDSWLGTPRRTVPYY